MTDLRETHLFLLRSYLQLADANYAQSETLHDEQLKEQRRLTARRWVERAQSFATETGLADETAAAADVERLESIAATIDAATSRDGVKH